MGKCRTLGMQKNTGTEKRLTVHGCILTVTCSGEAPCAQTVVICRNRYSGGGGSRRLVVAATGATRRGFVAGRNADLLYVPGRKRDASTMGEVTGSSTIGHAGEWPV